MSNAYPQQPQPAQTVLQEHMVAVTQAHSDAHQALAKLGQLLETMRVQVAALESRYGVQ